MNDLLAERRRKLDRLRAAGQEPFPYSFDRNATASEVLEKHGDLEEGQETESTYKVAGRLAARRGHGKAAFLDLSDRSGTIQLHARQDVLGEESFESLVSLDLGDLIGVEGTVFKTRRGELSLRVDDWCLLAKSMRPPPEKFHGLEDVEMRYRQRELDLIANEESRKLFMLRSKVIRAVRNYFDERGFLEVETPVLQPLYGGALARPFTTHHNTLNRDFYLRIATELYLKRLIVGGLEKVYEVGKNFRNEGISHKHNPEFTMLESYEAYADYRDVAKMLEHMVGQVATETLGSTKVKRKEEEIELAPPWRRMTLQEAIAEHTGVDILANRERGSLVEAVNKAGIEMNPKAQTSWAKLVDELLSKAVEPKLVQPTIVFDYPIELSPFAKRHRETEGLVERFEAFCGGIEIANAFTELNDPEDQRKRFEQQEDEAKKGDDETQPFDRDFLEALEHGMPPTGGLGVGIDRMVMILAECHSIREVILFPALREKSSPLPPK